MDNLNRATARNDSEKNLPFAVSRNHKDPGLRLDRVYFVKHAGAIKFGHVDIGDDNVRKMPSKALETGFSAPRAMDLRLGKLHCQQGTEDYTGTLITLYQKDGSWLILHLIPLSGIRRPGRYYEP